MNPLNDLIASQLTRDDITMDQTPLTAPQFERARRIVEANITRLLEDALPRIASAAIEEVRND